MPRKTTTPTAAVHVDTRAYTDAQPPARRHLRRLALAVIGLVASVTPLLMPGSAAQAIVDYGPNSCLQGYVWRDARPGDFVCVTGATRSQAAYDNTQAAARRDPNGGAWGPNTCFYGWVWRDAFAEDFVCVTGATRSQAAYDNAQAAARRNSVRVRHGAYTIPPVCTGDSCTSRSTDNIPRYRLHVDRLNVGPVEVQLRRLDNDLVIRSWNTQAKASSSVPGGELTLHTGVFRCNKPVDSYFQVRDGVSTRSSARYRVSTICCVL
jgi:hypothetical protein